jgi:hypothetical protein
MKMKKNNSTHEKVNLFFSAFLIIAYIICGYFFVSFANAQQSEAVKHIIMVAIFAIFGLLVFYATRVGEKKIVTRFSLATFIVLDLPTLYIILASFIEPLPFHAPIVETGNGAIALMAAVALGYGIPYTFISGFETVTEEELNKTEEKDSGEVLEGGIEADIQEAETEAEKEAPVAQEISEETTSDEIVVEGISSEE